MADMDTVEYNTIPLSRLNRDKERHDLWRANSILDDYTDKSSDIELAVSDQVPNTADNNQGDINKGTSQEPILPNAAN